MVDEKGFFSIVEWVSFFIMAGSIWDPQIFLMAAMSRGKEVIEWSCFSLSFMID